MLCDQVRAALASLPGCIETSEGMRFTTQCLYPSFEPVNVFVVGFGEGYKVHDGGGAVRSAWDHARELTLIRRMLMRQAAAYQIQIVDDSLVAEVPSIDWILPAILAVANASAGAVHAAMDRLASATESVLKDLMFSVLHETVPPKAIAKEYALTGKSGKVQHFDFAVLSNVGGRLLLEAVAPHHVSISAKYVAFSDTHNGTREITGRFAVHDRPLDAGDVSLLQQVADVVPFAAFGAGVAREMARA
jgi:hypothetical protein